MKTNLTVFKTDDNNNIVITKTEKFKYLQIKRLCKKMDYKKELQEIIDQIGSAKNRLADVTEAMDLEGREVDPLDEALDALDDAIDIMEDLLEEEEQG